MEVVSVQPWVPALINKVKSTFIASQFHFGQCRRHRSLPSHHYQQPSQLKRSARQVRQSDKSGTITTSRTLKKVVTSRMQSACVMETELIDQHKLWNILWRDTMLRKVARTSVRGGTSGRATGRTTIIDSRTSERMAEPEIGMIAGEMDIGRTGMQRTRCGMTFQVVAWIRGAKI